MFGAALVFAACSSSDDGQTEPPGSSSPTVEVDAATADELAGILESGRAAYLALSQAPVDGSGTGLDRWFVSGELAELRQRLAFLEESGRAARTPVEGADRVAIESVKDNNDGRLNVIYCVSGQTEVYDTVTGETVTPAGRLDRRFALMAAEADTWVVVEDELVDAFTDEDVLPPSAGGLPVCPL